MRFTESMFSLGITLARDKKQVWHRTKACYSREADTVCGLSKMQAFQFASPKPAFMDSDTKWCQQCFHDGQS